jgi:hypothetical protein
MIYTIYRIYNENFNYIGSTGKDIQQRLKAHQISYGRWVLSNFTKGYCTSFEVLKYQDYNIEEIDQTKNKKEKKQLEIFYINNCNCVNIQFNKSKPKIKISKEERRKNHSNFNLDYFINKVNEYFENKPSILKIEDSENCYEWQKIIDTNF